MWDAQLRAPTDGVDDQHVNLAQKSVNGILLVFRRQVKNPQSFSKLRSGVRTQLGEEKRRFSSFHFLVSHLEIIIA
jgi:hypothetical protein